MGLIIIAYFLFKNNIKKIGDPFILKLFNTLKLFGLSKSKCMMTTTQLLLKYRNTIFVVVIFT